MTTTETLKRQQSNNKETQNENKGKQKDSRDNIYRDHYKDMQNKINKHKTTTKKELSNHKETQNDNKDIQKGAKQQQRDTK